MNRDEQEMALWRCKYVASTMVHVASRADEADAAVAEFRKRYPPQSASASDIDKDAYAKGWILFLAMAGIGFAAFFAIAFAMAWI